MTIPIPRKVVRLFESIVVASDVFGFLDEVERKVQGCLGR